MSGTFYGSMRIVKLLLICAGTIALQDEARSSQVRLRLPDNPEGKSQPAFKFEKNVDALTYGWELANEVMNVATVIFSRIPAQDEP
jgi:hypothetical protein